MKEIAKELFAPPAKANSILLPGASTGKKAGKSKKAKGKEKEDKRDNQTLPDDMHFSSRQLVTLFLKPKFSVSLCDECDERCRLTSNHSFKCAETVDMGSLTIGMKLMRPFGRRPPPIAPQVGMGKTTQVSTF